MKQKKGTSTVQFRVSFPRSFLRLYSTMSRRRMARFISEDSGGLSFAHLRLTTDKIQWISLKTLLLWSVQLCLMYLWVITMSALLMLPVTLRLLQKSDKPQSLFKRLKLVRAALWQPVTDWGDAACSSLRWLSEEKYSGCPAPAAMAEPENYNDLSLLFFFFQFLLMGPWFVVLWSQTCVMVLGLFHVFKVLHEIANCEI